MSYLELYDPPSEALPKGLSIAAQTQGVSRSGKRVRRLSLQLSSDLHRQIKLIAFDDEETINSLVVGVLKRFVAEREEQMIRLSRPFGPG